MKNKKLIFGMSISGFLAIVSLVACGGNSAPSTTSAATSSEGTSQGTSEATSEGTSEISSEESSEVSSEAESSSSSQETSSSKPSRYLELDLKYDTLPFGSTTYDGAKPIVTWHDGDDVQDASSWTQRIRYRVTNNETGDVYSENDVLPVGEYTVRASYDSKNRHDTATLKIVEGTPEVASEGKGYHSLSVDDLSSYALWKHANMGALGDGKFPAKDIDGKHPKMIVIPVQFTDVTFDEYRSHDGKLVGGDFARAVIDEAFFAPEGETPWLSLKAYYEKSSYGQLHIEGETSPVITYPKTCAQFDADVKKGTDSVANIISYAMSQLEKTYGYSRKDYDLNGDGYVDGINVIYATNQPTPSSVGDDSSTWWNFTSVVSGSANLANPTPHRYFWSRYDYVMNSYYSNYEKEDGSYKGLRDANLAAVDAHTIIHENGHLMGLNDYYSYDHNEGPAGCVDMMDQNVGDHNAYSKMLYNWVAPKVIDGTSENFYIDLPSFTDTGEFILLKKTDENGSLWCEHPYDEYLILEYYTPTGVNYEDSDGYPEWSSVSTETGSNPYGHGGTYEDPGLKVFHVDARIASTFYKGSRPSSGAMKYTTNLVDAETTLEDGTKQTAAIFPHDNTPSRSSYGQAETYAGVSHKAGESNCPYREFSAVFASGANSLKSSSYANIMGQTKNLFGDPTFTNAKGEDNIYGGNVYTNFKMKDFFPKTMQFDDDSQLNWTFSVDSQTESSIRLHFIKNAD
ncbi:MAG: hypothetical protein SPL02_00670 [Bacilli bacterium]|nr:hypothetical protein [Bacilli bacterium]MDY6430361.1 hypothetical protein [Bacilli bacterium]